MGFDIECIVDIHSYPGEYFCPVCRTLVYPNEAYQSQCTHLYCKPCLAHIANGSKACPYDGYLVTESDSKRLTDSDKTLAEKIGKVKVHCLFFKSGCTWEGTLSDCTSHCAGCSFGNSPVICNRCGIQIMHSQVNAHAQTCPGAYVGQQGVGGVSGSTANQTVAQPGAPITQAQNPHNVAPTPAPAQNPNPSNASSQAQVVAPVAMPTPEQWYQQQYQQYYQQYAAYDPYQQTNQQYYPVQQPPFQQYQQHQLQVQAQPLASVYAQPQAQPNAQSQPQPHPPQPPAQIQSNPLPVAPPPPQSQVPPQAQPQQQLSQGQPQGQVPPQGQGQGQGQVNLTMQASIPNYQVNPQQQLYPPMRPPQTHFPSQALPPAPQNQSTQPPQFTQAMGMRPPSQHAQVAQYQQPHVQMHHPQVSQPQMHHQVHLHTQSSNQPHMQLQPQAQPYHTHSQPPLLPQENHSTLQAPHPPAPPVSGHHSYQQPQPAQKMQALQQHAVQPHPAGGTLHPAQVVGQVPQTPGQMRPPHSQGSLSQLQPPSLLTPQNQASGIPSAQHQQAPHLQQPMHPLPHRPLVMQPVQQPQHYAQQQHFVAPFPPSQVHHQGHLAQQQPMQSHSRPPALPQPQQSQQYFGRPIVLNQGIHSQNYPIPSGGFGSLGQSAPVQHASAQTSMNQNYTTTTVVEQNKAVQEARSPSKVSAEKGFDGESLKEETVQRQNETAAKDTGNGAKDGVHGSLEQASLAKSFEAGGVEHGIRKEGGRPLEDSDSLRQKDLESQQMKSKTVVDGSSSANDDMQPRGQVQGQTPLVPGPQGPGVFPQPGQSLNLPDGRMPGYFGPPKSFESQPGPQGSALADDPRGVSRGPPPRFEGQSGPHNVFRPSDVAMKVQMSGAARLSGFSERDSLMRTNYNTDEPSFMGMNGGKGSASSFGSSDEKLKSMSREYLNPFPREPTCIFDQASRTLDKAPHGPIYDTGSKVDSGAFGPHSRFVPNHPSGGNGHMDMFGPGPELGQHHLKHLAHRSPDREYLGPSPRSFGGHSGFPHRPSAFDDINFREAHGFGEASRSFNLSGLRRRGESDGPGNPRFGERMGPGQLPNQIGRDDVFGPDGPNHFMRGQFSGPGSMSGNFHMAETAGSGGFGSHLRGGDFGGPGMFPRLPLTDSARGNRPGFSHFGESAMTGFSNSGNFSGGMDSFDHSRKRKPTSAGWCRICSLDCQTVEGLDMHSQTREHQKMAMDMVKSIKLQNQKKQRIASGMAHEGASRNRKAGMVGRGSKP